MLGWEIGIGNEVLGCSFLHQHEVVNIEGTTIFAKYKLEGIQSDFFTAPSWAENGKGTVVGSNNVLSTVAIGNEVMEAQYLKELLLEKDKRISTLENFIKLLETNLNKD